MQGTNIFSAVGLVVVATSAGCFFADNEALLDHMRGECLLVPAEAPRCAAEDGAHSEGALFAYDEFFRKKINSEREQACFLDVDCDQILEEGGDPYPALLECTSLDRGFGATAVSIDSSDQDQLDCLFACSDELFNCGPDDADECTAAVVDACLRAHDECKRPCADK